MIVKVTSVVAPLAIGGMIFGDIVKENSELESRICISESPMVIPPADASDMEIWLCPETILAWFGIATVPVQFPLAENVGVPEGVMSM